MKSNLTDIEVYLHHETEKAWLVSLDGETKVWIPKSQAELDPFGRGHKHITPTFTLTAPEPLLIEKGLI